MYIVWYLVDSLAIKKRKTIDEAEYVNMSNSVLSLK